MIAYHKHERFYYVKPIDNFQNTLAFRAGIRLYDRIIEVNGTNIENDANGTMIKQITNQAQLIQLLLCSPATYEHYRTENEQLHSNLETVKLMRPVRSNQSKKNIQYKSFLISSSLSC
jgi:C-terminal processing protease CtpA/Prc